MSVYRFVICSNRPDPRSTGYLSNAQALGFHNLQRIECQDLYFVEGQLSQDECKQLALKLLIDPVTQSAAWDKLPAALSPRRQDTVMVEVALRPGVTDAVAHELVRAARELGFKGLSRAATGMRFLLYGIDQATSENLAQRLLSNNVIQHWTLGEITPSFPQTAASSGAVETIPVRGLNEAGLLALSQQRRAALDLDEMKAIQDYFCEARRDPTDVEFEMIAQTWSEHCVHKTFKAKIDVKSNGKSGPAASYPSTIDSLIRTYLRAATDRIKAPFVLSAFVDNAGILDFDEEYEISFKAETHNHPSAVEPFGGANTGIGGVIRDVLGVGHKPIAATDVLCFGPQQVSLAQLPDGVLHPRRIMSGVVAGIQDYGNKIGIPTVNGAVLFDEGYQANPLVFCGCVGIAPKGERGQEPQSGDRVIILGGRTGRDGLRGATFSSMTMDAQTGDVAGASVQIGDPITEKGLIDVITRARSLRLYHAITDCGAGGFSSAVGEMASTIGADIELQDVKLKYPGLAPWEIWLSEAQERMVLAVPPENVPALQDLCDIFDTELTDIGEFRGSARLVVRYDGNVILELANAFLHDGIPQRRLTAVIDSLETSKPATPPSLSESRYNELLLALLAHPNIASKASVVRLYDHEVQGGIAVKPLTGILADGPSDASVIRPHGVKSRRGIALANGINPEYGKRHPYRMAFSVVDEAIRNAVAVGTDPQQIALLDNFCWGDPLQPKTLGSLLEAARGCYDAALFFGTPFVSGKDSLNNEYLGADGARHAIPPTLLISSLGIVEDVEQAITMDLKEAGNSLYLVGAFEPTFGGAHLLLVADDLSALANDPVPSPAAQTPAVYQALHAAMRAEWVRSAHDLSEGGLAVTVAEMCLAGRLGAQLDVETDAPLRFLFGETAGCLVAEVAPHYTAAFESHFAHLPLRKIGTVANQPNLSIRAKGQTCLSLSIDALVKAWNTPLQ